MSIRSRIGSLLKNIMLRDRIERDLDDELRAYVEMAADEKRGTGLSDEDARRAALIELGGVEQVRESVRDARTGALIEQFRQDLFYACRMLRRNPGLTAVAVTTLALGIGANSAIFSIVDTIVLRPLPYTNPESLVKIWGSTSPAPTDNVSLPDFLDIRDRTTVFELIAADDGTQFTIAPGEKPREAILGAQVTAGWLDGLGVHPFLGRGFAPDEARAGNDRVVLLTHSYWRRHFASDRGIVGRQLVGENGAYTVIGVLPPNVLRYSNDFLKPLVESAYSHDRGYHDLDVFGRLKPGVTIEQARGQLDSVAAQLQREYPATNKNLWFKIAPLEKSYAMTDPQANRGLMLMLSAVGLVLLIACANVANLLLARAVTRSRECVIRAALGAGRLRLVRQMLVESVLLFMLGGAAGIVLAKATVESLLTLAVTAGYVPERMAVAVDVRVLLFTLVISIVAGVMFGLLPALQASKVDLHDGLRASSPSSSVRRRHLCRLLVVSELAISVVLLVACGLMIRSFLRVQASTGGIDVQNLLETQSEGGRSFPEALAFWRMVLDRVHQDPGVLSAAVTSRPPIHGSRGEMFDIEGRASSPDDAGMLAGDILVSEDYFKTMGIRLVKGRAFSDKDSGTSIPVVIVSDSLTRRYFPNQDPLGKRVRLREHSPKLCCTSPVPLDGVWREIVGVAADIRQGSLDEQPAMTLYRPFSQIVEHDMFLMVRARSAADAARLGVQLQPQLLAIDRTKEWADVRPMHEVISTSASVSLRRFVLILFGIFAGLAALLAAVGTYGVMSYVVVDRTREIGIRVALGATRTMVFQQVLSEAVGLAFAGLVIGCLASLALTRFITSLLFGITATDMATYIAVSGVLGTIALVASYVPARRATAVDPLIALRQE